MPRDAAGKPLPLLVLAMGKLGGGELNFSSRCRPRIPLPDAAVAAGSPGALDAADEPSEPETYYLRVAQLLIKLLDQATPDGFVYRVDARLRPFGASGPLVVSVSSFESYLVQHGRDWERYAYVKARLITGLEFERDVFDLVLTPFVYRRYLDYGVFDALRQMKTLIAKEVARKDMAENIKLGPGGIREIEFITQAFQLVRGRASRRAQDALAAGSVAAPRGRPAASARCGRPARRGVSVPAHARESPPGARGPANSRAAPGRRAARTSRLRARPKTVGATSTRV